MDGQDGDNKQSTADMTVFVQNLLQQMQTRFQTMSESIISKIICSIKYNSEFNNLFIAFLVLRLLSGSSFPALLSFNLLVDEMGNRIDELEQSINDLRGEMGQDAAAPSPSASLKPKEEPTKPADDSA